MNHQNPLDLIVESKHLLKHSFYQRWMNGTLMKHELQTYAKNYFPHVLAFPQYVSGVHSQCDDADTRAALLDNLVEEEHGPENHPELWLRFAEGLGVNREEIKAQDQLLPEALELVTTFKSLVKKSYASGIGALYAYESQVPTVAEQKIEGLKKNYQIVDEKTLQFFEVHRVADQYHSQAQKTAYDKLSDEGKKEALEACDCAATALWNFLSAVDGSETTSCAA